jgi:hypothetical protein
MRYTIVKHDSLEKLVDHVNALFVEGWQLAGGCSAIAVPNEIACGDTRLVTSERHYAQAMVHLDLAPATRAAADCPACAGSGQTAPAG